MKQDREYILLLDFFARLVESTKGTVLDAETRFLADTQPLAAKFVLHCGTIFHLTRGTKLPNLLGKELSYLDHHSIIVLVRAVHELYLAFNFIYVVPSTIEDKKLRHNIWELGAFLDRQKFPATEEENIKKLQSEKEVVAELTTAVETNPAFKNLTASQQDKAVNGEWRLGYGWVDLAEFAGLDKEGFRATYRYLCSYAHTGHLSIFQMQQAADISDVISLTEVWIDSVMGVISHFIYDYVKLYPKAVELFKRYPEAEQLAYINDGLGRKAIEANGGA
jgi:hypothetical protein